jgi:hypothetical protein
MKFLILIGIILISSQLSIDMVYAISDDFYDENFINIKNPVLDYECGKSFYSLFLVEYNSTVKNNSTHICDDKYNYKIRNNFLRVNTTFIDLGSPIHNLVTYNLDYKTIRIITDTDYIVDVLDNGSLIKKSSASVIKNHKTINNVDFDGNLLAVAHSNGYVDYFSLDLELYKHNVGSNNIKLENLLVDFKGHTKLYTKPECIAVLEAPPYFKEIRGINNGGSSSSSTIMISYTHAKSITTSNISNWGVYFKNEAVICGVGLEFYSQNVLNNIYSNTITETSTNSTIFKAETEHNIVIHSTPIDFYFYKVKDNIVIVEKPGSPVYKRLTLSKYDIFRKSHPYLPDVKNLIHGIPGQPDTYLNSFNCPMELGYSGGSSELREFYSKTESNKSEATELKRLQFGAGVKVSFPFDIGDLKSITGVILEIGDSYQEISADTNSIEFRACIHDINPEFENCYMFNWGLNSYIDKATGILVLGYIVNDVKK